MLRTLLGVRALLLVRRPGSPPHSSSNSLLPPSIGSSNAHAPTAAFSSSTLYVCSKRQLDADRTLVECQHHSVVVNMARLRGRRPADLSQEPPQTTTQDPNHIRVYRPYRQEAISCSHVQPYILFLITGSTILLIDFLLLHFFLSFFFF